MEVKYGLAINPQRALKIQSLVEALLDSITILPFSVEEAEQAAQIRSILKTAGTPIGSYDVLIAATALTHNHIVVTSNVREFQRVNGLQIENWRSS
ncbi:MAG: PIN domain-containing protein [Nostoc sp.]|uniref:PIN domain-containing protein n=1 Tax=Nostoc sp. TaxID=1180 RepID=UPI002FF2FC29